jgi:hypothetical protein
LYEWEKAFWPASSGGEKQNFFAIDGQLAQMAKRMLVKNRQSTGLEWHLRQASKGANKAHLRVEPAHCVLAHEDV